MDNIIYGRCPMCNEPLKPEWDILKETFTPLYGGTFYSGRYKKVCSGLFCPFCGKKYIADDRFDGPWIYE